MNIIQYIQKFSTTTLDSILATESKTSVLENGSKFVRFNFDGTASVQIADILMDGLSDYYRANSRVTGNGTNYNGAGHYDGYKVGAFKFDWKNYDLRYDRGKQFQIDTADNEENAGLIIGNLFSEFVKTQVVPEVDALRFSTLAKATYASLGNKITETINGTKGDAHEIIHSFNTAFEWLTEHNVPESEQVIFVSPATWKTISNTEEIYKTLTQVDYNAQNGVTFNLKAYMGRPIIEVPSDRFYDDVVVGDGGYHPTESAHVLNYLVCSVRSVVPVVKLATAKVFSPDVVQDFDGYKANYRIYHDCIVPKNKIVSCFASVSNITATSLASKLGVALSEGSTTGNFKLDNYFTNPAGMLGVNGVVMKKTAIKLGEVCAPNGSTIVRVNLNGETTGTEFSTAYFALLGEGSTAIAVSGATSVPLKA